MNPYEFAVGLAVEAKRYLRGLGEQRKFTDYLESIERKSRDELHELQAVELSAHLKHAVDNIPFYKDLSGNLELSPKTAHEDIKSFPILTKKTVMENFNDFLLPGKVHGKKYKGGGSTGNDINVIRDRSEVVFSADEYFNRMANVYPGKSRLLIRRAEAVYFAEKAHDVTYSANPVTRTYIVSPAYMDNERLELLYSIYKKRKPSLILGITDPVYRLARYILDSGKPVRPVEAVLVGGQTMLPKYRKTIEKAFGTKNVYDRYGATEFGILGHQCEKFDGLHYVPVIHHVEVLDDDNKDAGIGNPGQFIVTNMRKREMPVIRYKIDDLAVLTDEQCSCGRTFPMVKRFEGRRIESVVSPKHTYMTPLPFYEIISGFSNVDDFLIEQREESTVTVMLKMKSGEFTLVQQLALRKEINRYLDYPMKLDVEYIDEIIPMPNGKVLRVRGYENFKK